MRSGSKVRIVATLLLMASFSGSAFLAHSIDKSRPPSPEEETLYLNSPRLARYFSLGFTGLAADIYWIKTVQYFGGKHYQRSRRYDLLYPLLELTTGLDPHLLVAYEFGSTFLAQQPPEGAGTPEQAVQLVKEGIHHNPNAWRLYYQLGFIYYTELKNYEMAAEAFKTGSEVPGAYPWMKIMAALMTTRAGERETARYMWINIYESSDDPNIRENALSRLLALKIDEEVADLQKVVDRYRRDKGHSPTAWNELAQEGYLPGIPKDPTGAPFDLGPRGRVLVHDPDRIPFIEEGLPEGKAPQEVINPAKAVKPSPAELLKQQPERR